jgi:hypothetical protein
MCKTSRGRSLKQKARSTLAKAGFLLCDLSAILKDGFVCSPRNGPSIRLVLENATGKYDFTARPPFGACCGQGERRARIVRLLRPTLSPKCPLRLGCTGYSGSGPNQPAGKLHLFSPVSRLTGRHSSCRNSRSTCRHCTEWTRNGVQRISGAPHKRTQVLVLFASAYAAP